jgi:capsid protein
MSTLTASEYPQPWTFAHGASRDRTRGPQFSDRNADIEKLIPSTDRKRLVSISSRLFMNMGVPKAAIRQKADYTVGEAWLPSYTGASDSDKGKSVANFMKQTWLPACDVRGGVHDWHKLLELTSIAIDRDGDAFWLLVKGEDGFPRIQQIPGHRVDSCGYRDIVQDGAFKGFKIRDGIIYYKSGRPAAYRVITGEDATKFEDIPAGDIIHIFDPTYQEQGRGLPSFTHAIEDLKHCLCSTEDERIRQMIISRLHLVEYNDTGGPDESDPAVALEEVVAASGDSPAQNVLVERMDGGKVYMKANSGHKFETIKHENPGPIWESFQNRMIRNSIAGMGWALSLVWENTGQGTAERMEVLKARRAVQQRQSLIFHAARRAFAWAYSVFQQSGRVSLLRSPTAWDFNYPARLTVDDGREASAMRDDYRLGKLNMGDLLEAEGKNLEDHLRSRVSEAVLRKKLIAEAEAANPGIKIDEREMVMWTANEQGAETAPPAPTNPEQ